MKQQKQSWREHAAGMRIHPSERVWTRLENRLDQDQGKIKISTLRKWMAIAASMLVITIAYFLLNAPIKNQEKMVLSDLEPVPNATFASYRYASQVNAIYEGESWKHISEGTKRRLKGKKEFGTSPPILNQDDSL